MLRSAILFIETKMAVVDRSNGTQLLYGHHCTEQARSSIFA